MVSFIKLNRVETHIPCTYTLTCMHIHMYTNVSLEINRTFLEAHTTWGNSVCFWENNGGSRIESDLGLVRAKGFCSLLFFFLSDLNVYVSFFK